MKPLLWTFSIFCLFHISCRKETSGVSVPEDLWLPAINKSDIHNIDSLPIYMQNAIKNRGDSECFVFVGFQNISAKITKVTLEKYHKDDHRCMWAIHEERIIESLEPLGAIGITFPIPSEIDECYLPGVSLVNVNFEIEELWNSSLTDSFSAQIYIVEVVDENHVMFPYGHVWRQEDTLEERFDTTIFPLKNIPFFEVSDCKLNLL